MGRILFVRFVILCGSQVFADSGPKSKIDFLVTRIKEHSSISVHYLKADMPQPPSARTYDIIPESDYDKLLTYVTILQCELNKMNKQMVINSGLSDICLVTNLKFNNKTSFGTTFGQTMFLEYLYGNTDDKRRVIYHEFFHVLDRAYNKPDDPWWQSLNDPNFVYTHNYDISINRRCPGNMDYPQNGFVTKYAMISPAEDKAVIYAALSVPAQAKTLDGWAKSDEILARKIRYIKKFSIMASKPKGTVPWPDPNAKF
jgi:hypothetical protein